MIGSVRNAVHGSVDKVRVWWNGTLGIWGIGEDIVANARSRRLTKEQGEELAATKRTVALAEARKGCTHTPTCPPAGGPDRMKAVEIFADDTFVYLCNGLVLSVEDLRTPPFPHGVHDHIPTPLKEATP